jgi:cobalt-zinc-cadmium efflux system outer membrane protein
VYSRKTQKREGEAGLFAVSLWWCRSAVLAVLAALAIQIIEPNWAGAEPLTIERVVAIASESNPDLLAARQELENARARVIKAHYLNQFNPQVQGGASQAHFQFAPGSAAQPTGSVSLELEVAGQRGKRIEEADQNFSKAKANIADAERLAKARVEYAFYQALYLRQRLELTQRIEVLNQRLRDASVVRFHSGETPKLEANLGSVRYDLSRKAVLLARRDYENGLRAVQRVLGIKPRGAFEISGSLLVKAIEIDPEKAVLIALVNRPDLQARNYEIKRVAADIALTRRLIIPNPTISGFVERTTDAPGQSIRVLGGAIGISIPLFDRKQAELTALNGEQRRASYERTATQLNVEQQVRDSLAAYDASRETLQVFETDAVERVKDSFGLIEESYRSGKTDLLQLIVAENELVVMDSSYLDSLWDYWVARIDVETAVGADFASLTKP